MGNWLMEPDEAIAGYDDVSWYRRTWFVIVTLLLFWPLTLLIVLTGPIFQKANRKAKERSDAEVWRSTGPGRAVMLVSFAVLGLLATFTYVLPLLDSIDDDDGRRTIVATPASDDEPAAEPERTDDTRAQDVAAAAPETAAPGDAETDEATTLAPTTTAPPVAPAPTGADDRLEALRGDLLELATASMGGSDPTAAILAMVGDDRFVDFPVLDGTELRYLSLSYELDDQPQYAISTIARTPASADEAVAQLQQLAAARGHVQDGLEDETEDGERTISIEHAPLAGSAFGFEGLNFDVTETAEGTEVRVFRFIIDPATPATSTLLVRAGDTFVTPEGHEWFGTGFTLSEGFAGADADVEINYRGPVPNGERNALFDEYLAVQSSWVEEERLDTITRFGHTGLDLDAYLSVYSNDDRTDVTVRIG